jgi:hypothetical protein
MNEAVLQEQDDAGGRAIQPQLLPATPKGNHRNGAALLTLVPDYIPAEVSLENMGYFTPSSKRVKDIYIKEKVLGYKTGSDGIKRMITAKISANHELGLPITSDFDYYRAFLKICDEVADAQGRLHMPIAVPTGKLINYAGKSDGAREKREVRAWLKRMAFTGIEGGIYRAKTKVYEDEFVGTVFSQVVLHGKKMKNGEVAETNYVWPAPWFLANYFHHHVRRIDLNFHQRLRKPIAKALYPLLETGWYASNGKPYAKSYRNLCQEFLLSNRQHLSRIREQLDPAHQELAKERFLAKWDYRESADKTDYIITYHPGEKFFADQEAKEERRQRAEQITNGQGHSAAHQPIPEDQPFHEESKARRDLLVEDILEVTGDRQSRGFYGLVARKLDPQMIYRAISETKEASRNGEIRTNRARYFTDLVKRYATQRNIIL